METTIMENPMEKTMENEMETANTRNDKSYQDHFDKCFRSAKLAVPKTVTMSATYVEGLWHGLGIRVRVLG